MVNHATETAQEFLNTHEKEDKIYQKKKELEQTQEEVIMLLDAENKRLKATKGSKEMVKLNEALQKRS